MEGRDGDAGPEEDAPAVPQSWIESDTHRALMVPFLSIVYFGLSSGPILLDRWFAVHESEETFGSMLSKCQLLRINE